MSNHAQNPNFKEEAQELLKSSILLTFEQKQEWTKLIESMDDEDLKNFINLLKDSEAGVESVLAKAFEEDQEGKLIKKFRQFKRKALKEMDAANQDQESEDAEVALEESLKNL